MQRAPKRRLVKALRFLAALVLAAALMPTDAWAPPGGGGSGGGGGGDPCAGLSSLVDSDQDGFNDLQEGCDGLSTGAGDAFSFPSCNASGASPPDCLDVSIKNVFVVWDKDSADPSGSAYDELGISDTEAFEMATQPVSSGGLGIRIHVLPPTTTFLSTCPRCITPGPPSQAAARITEVRGEVIPCPLPSTLPPLGTASFGNPNEYGTAEVFSGRALSFIDCVYDTEGDTTTDRDPIKRLQLKNTLVHELDHLLKEAPEDVARNGGHHYRTGSNCIMDQQPVVSVKGGNITWKIPDQHCAPTQDAISAGATDYGGVVCGDDTTLDFDPTESCLPASP